MALVSGAKCVGGWRSNQAAGYVGCGLYPAGKDGDVFVVKAGRQYEWLSRNAMGQPPMATPALSQGMLIVRGENAIYPLGGS